MTAVRYINRQNGRTEDEQIYGEWALKLVYSDKPGSGFLRWIARQPWVSTLYGWIQKSRWSKRKVRPFIAKYGVDESEFRDSTDSFGSFNDFFVRHLKQGCRPLSASDAIMPADGRYMVYPNISEMDGLFIKGETFTLAELLGDPVLAGPYEKGSMVLGRLCPTDYHRFHFPCDAYASKPNLINGCLASVNPLALRRSARIIVENRRTVTMLRTKQFGEVLYLEIGATNVGSICQTFTPDTDVKKGSEKGYFSFGASAIIMLFLPQTIAFETDLLSASSNRLEMKCLLGQPLGSSFQPREKNNRFSLDQKI